MKKERTLTGVILLLLLVFLGSTEVRAKDLYVSTNGTDEADCGNITNPCLTPNQAVDNARAFDTIIMNSGTYFIGSTINITIPLTLQAADNNTVNLYSTNCTVLFANCDFARSVYIIGINFIGGSYSPVIKGLSTLELFTCNIENNHFDSPKNSQGVLIDFEQSLDSILINNTRICGNTFTVGSNNLNGYYGTFLSINNVVHVTMNDVIFNDNVFKNTYPWDSFNVYGGFIYIASLVSDISNCIFKNNTFTIQNGVHLQGGIMLISSKDTSMFNCSFVANQIDTNPSINSGGIAGGALSISQAPYMNANFVNISFLDNVFKFCGGEVVSGIFYSPTYTFADTIIIINNTIEYSPSGNIINGGLAFFGRYYTLFNVQIIDNHIFPRINTTQSSSCLTAAVTGALVYSALYDVRNMIISNNSFTMSSSDYCYSGEVTGLFYVINYDSMRMSDSIFYNNTIYGGNGISGSNVAGGGLVLQTLNSTLINCTFSENTIIAGNASLPRQSGSGAAGSAFGGAITATSPINLINCTFLDNSIIGGYPVEECETKTNFPVSRIPGSALGGAIYIEGNSQLSISACTFACNQAISAGVNSCDNTTDTPSSGGTIYSINLEMENSTITNSFCNYCKGGAIFSNNLTISNCNITSSYVSSGFGGSIYLLFNSNFVTDNYFFIDKRKRGDDGTIASVDLENVYLFNNTIEEGYGGVIYMDEIQSVNFTNVIMENNSASYGGGIYYQTFPQSLTFNSFLMIENQAEEGGAVFIANYKEFENILTAPLINGRPAYLSSLFSPAQFANEMTNNTASEYGNDCASSIYSLTFFINPPIHAWPGETFESSLHLIDIFGNIVITPDYEVTVAANNPSIFSSGVPQDTVKVDLTTGLYIFPSSVLLSQPGEVVVLQYSTIYLNSTFSTTANVTTTSCPPGYKYSNSLCYLCTSSEYNFDGEDCMNCPNEGGELVECMIPLSKLIQDECETDDIVCHLEQCKEMNLSEVECSEIILGEISILEVPQGFWPVPTANEFMNPTSLIACEKCQPFICELQWFEEMATDSEYDWSVNCSRTYIVENSEECPYNEIDGRCCLGYTNRICSQCVSGFYAKGEECEECSSEWYSSFWMAPVDLFVFGIAIAIALYFRNNLIALCAEIFVLVLLYLLGVGTLFFLLSMCLVFSVLFITNADIREGILKSFIFYIQTCSLLLTSLFGWDTSNISGDIDFISRNGLECYFDWYNSIVGFWFMMALPLLILFMCLIIWKVGNKIHKTIHSLPKSRSRSKINSDLDHDHHKITPVEKWDCLWVKICLFLWYVIYYEISARVIFYISILSSEY